MGLQTGQIIEGKYSILRLLGEGGMGAVYEGENVRIHRKVAIKVLHAGIAENVDAVARFEREAQAAGRIGSDHIVEVLDLGNLPGGDRFMVMEYLDGESLSQRIQSRVRLTPHEAVPLMTQLLEGLGAAHGAGIIHRDLKPDNVYLLRNKKGQGDFVKILDFGISKFNKLNSDSGMSMTRTGAVMGTPYYMSPEQAKGSKEMDHRSDLYSIGVILYEAITGQVPFNAETFNELIFKIVLDVPAPPEQHVPGLDPAFSSIMRKSMAREQADRFQTAQEFSEALQSWAGSGQGVTVAAGQPTAHRGPQASAPMLGQTPPPWASTGGLANEPTMRAPAKGGGAKTVIISVGLAAVLAVIGVVGLKVLRKPEPANSTNAANVVVSPVPPQPTVVEPAKVEPEKRPEPPPAETPAATASAVPTAALAAILAGGKKPGQPPAPQTGKRPAGQTPPAVTPPPVAPPVAPAAPAGRRIRTEL